MDEFAAIDRQTQLITATTIVVLLILLLIVYRSAITATVPLLSVVVSLAVAKPIVSGPGATIVDEFAAIDRQTQLITATTIVVLLILLLIV